MLGLDAVASVANVVYLVSYSVRDILWLRILTVLGGTLLMPYYYLQPTPLWTPIAWNVVFLSVNIYWIIKLFLDRRPVPFNEDEKRLYDLALRNMHERDAFKLLRSGRWTKVPATTTLLTQGKPVSTLTLIVEGEVTVEMEGEPVDILRGGRFLGGIAFLNGAADFATPVTVRTTRPTRIIEWNRAELEAQLVKETDLRVAIEACLGLEISRFLQTARTKLLHA